MNIRYTLTLVITFVFIFVLNLVFILKYNHNVQIHESQARILKELENLGSVDSSQFASSHPPLVLGAFESDVKLKDGRAANLQRYLRSINSPLFEYAGVIVEEADEKGYDYTLLVAIAGQESTFCRNIPKDSYNCWGWGIYGDKITKFSSFEEGIRVVSNGIKTNYIDKGLLTTEAIMNKYTPSSNGSWAYGVRYFFTKIHNQ